MDLIFKSRLVPTNQNQKIVKISWIYSQIVYLNEFVKQLSLLLVNKIKILLSNILCELVLGSHIQKVHTIALSLYCVFVIFVFKVEKDLEFSLDQ